MPQTTLHNVPLDESLPYAVTDAIATYLIYEPLLNRVVDANLTSVFDLDMGVIPAAAHMMKTGMLVDRAHFAKVSLDLGGRISVLDQKMFKIAGRQFNPDSPDQMSALLYDELRLHEHVKGKIKRTKGGTRLQSDAKALKAIREHHPIVPLLIQRRALSKMKGTFVDALPLLVHRDGRIHTTLRITRVPSGRFASARPNLQQIPTRVDPEIGLDEATAKLVRQGFIAPDGYYLLSIDLSGIEMRVAGHLSGDRLLHEMFWDDSKDIHYETAARIFGKKIIDSDDKKERYQNIDKATERMPCKSVGFLILYGGTALGLSEELTLMGLTGWDESRCEQLIKDWFAVYKGVHRWTLDNQSFVRMNGYVEDMFGRRILIPQVRSSQSKLSEEGLRLAGNAPIQGSAAGLLKRATILAWREMKKIWAENRKADLLMSVHDELIFESPKPFVEELTNRMLPCFENCYQMTVPIKASAAYAINWGDIEK